VGKEKGIGKSIANIRNKVITGVTAVLMFVPNITNTAKAGWYYSHFHNSSSIRNRVRWSPQTHSLIPGNLKYHPSAFNYDHPSGLVHRDTHWNPYAFGLVKDHSRSYTGFLHDPHNNLCNLPLTVIHHTSLPCVSNSSNLSSKIKQSSQQRINARKARIQATKFHRAKINELIENDPIKKIYEHLQNKNIDFKTNNFLKISNKTISVDLFLPGNLMIKYWNPEEINSLEGYRRSFYENYKNRWEEDSERYKKQGQQILTINRLEDLVEIFN